MHTFPQIVGFLMRVGRATVASLVDVVHVIVTSPADVGHAIVVSLAVFTLE